jgi:hypothetical protein
MGVFRSQHVDGESARCGVGGPLDVESTRMPLQYAEKINAARSGMARAAVASGRDRTVYKEE